MSIAENLARVRERISAAARAAARSPQDIVLMAVSKTFPPERIREAYDAGQRLFGENRVQEFAQKALALAGLADAEFHMIGHLQSNKARKAVELFTAIDSLDSPHLAEKLNAARVAWAPSSARLPVLIEINLGNEETKSGVLPGSPQLDDLLHAAQRLPALEIRGLMAIPPFAEDPEASRVHFRVMRQLRDQIAALQLPAIRMDVLSIGMSHDFEVAIQEGSTCVRLGTAIFGARIKP